LCYRVAPSLLMISRFTIETNYRQDSQDVSGLPRS
jgi:hypothetical protein